MNLPSIVAVGDAWSLGPSRNFIMNEVLRSLRNPQKLMRYVARGVEWTYANTGGHVFTRAVNLPKPIFRYWSLFPLDFLEKAAKHAEMFRYPGFHETIAILKNHVDDPPFFWEKAAEIWRKGPLGFNYPTAIGIAKPQDHPKIVQELVSSRHLTHYYVRDEVLHQISEL